MPYIGETAGLLTSLFFAANAIVISRAGAQVGSVIVNRTRVIFALIYLLVLNFILFHEPLPLEAGSFRWTWLALSGVVGLAIGDAFLIQAYVSIGPRLGTLLLSLSTVFGVLEAWLLFGETLRLAQIIGIALTLSGILWVVLERGIQSPATSRPPDPAPDIVLQSAAPDPIPVREPRSAPSLLGIFFGVMGALGQATGLVFSRQGMVGNFSPYQRQCHPHARSRARIVAGRDLAKQGGRHYPNLEGQSFSHKTARTGRLSRTRPRRILLTSCRPEYRRGRSKRAHFPGPRLHVALQPFPL